MLNLFILNEIITNNLNYNFLNAISIISVLCGILVIISKNPIVSVLFLIGLFISIAGYLMMLGINFIGLSYLLVYVGAVSILFLFILMLINVRISELVTDNSNSIPLAIMISIFVNINQLSSRTIGIPSIMIGVLNFGYTDKLDYDYSNTHIAPLSDLFFVTSPS
jgi:NADH-ubiquinone oxidoreductase chain 6